MEGWRESRAPGEGHGQVQDRDGVWLESAGKKVIGSWSGASRSRSGVTTGRSCLSQALYPLLLAWWAML